MITWTDLIGKPYHRGGRGPENYDCYGLCLEVTRRAGITIPEVPTPLTRTDRNEAFVLHKDQSWHKISKPIPYCLVVFRFLDKNGNFNWHAGVVLPDLQSFIHVTAGINVTVSKLDALKWTKRFDGFYHIQDNEDSTPA